MIGIYLLGILFGLAVAAGLAYFIASSVLVKSNDFGDEPIDLQQYAGYDPIFIENAGQVNSSYRL